MDMKILKVNCLALFKFFFFFKIGPKFKSHNEMSNDEFDDHDSVGDGDCNGVIMVVIDIQFMARSRLKLSLEDREVPGSSPRSLSRDR